MPSFVIKSFYIRIFYNFTSRELGALIQSKGQHIKKSKSFTQQEVDLSEAPLFLPEGFEKIFLIVYFLLLPYIVGLLFLFFYVANGKTEPFLFLSEKSSFILIWAIGYEIIAGLTILYIIKKAISFSAKSSKTGRNIPFKRP